MSKSIEEAMTVTQTGKGLRVVVDLNRCQAYAQCCYAAPEHFVLQGREALFYHPAPPLSARDAVERARLACPVQAIRVEVVTDRAA